MLVTLILISALIAGGAVLLSVQNSSSKSSDLTRSGMTALYCAEAGLTAARPIVASNYNQWGTALAACGSPPCTEPTWMTDGINAMLGSHDLDGDGAADFVVYIRDNNDEISPTPNDTAADSDLQVFIVSRCIKYPDTPKQIEELVLFAGGTACYHWQIGGCSGGGTSR